MKFRYGVAKMSDERIAQTLLAWENLLSGCGLAEEAFLGAQRRGWIDAEGKPTEDGRDLFEALTTQMEQTSVFRNLV